ncbi:MAG: lamin tail domain-containing protein [Candidatus Shapirobacteria bacterium]
MFLFILLFLLLNKTACATDSQVLINKFQYNPPLDKSEWVELYNPNDIEIDLNGWQLVDESNTKKLLTGKKIAPKGFLTYEDGKSWLNNDGDSVFLKIGESTIDSLKYVVSGKKVTVNDKLISEEFSDLKGKWIGRSVDGEDEWIIFSDTEAPIGGGISYFNGYKTIIENIGTSITIANDKSGIGSTLIKILESDLINNECNNFIATSSNVSDGKCYKFEYVATDGVGNIGVFKSDSIVKFDATKPELFTIDRAWRNILKLKSIFSGTDLQSGVRGYIYSIMPDVWTYTDNHILNIGYSGNPLSICGKTINNAKIESDISCQDFTIDLEAPKIVTQTNPNSGKYKIGDKLPLSFEFDEEIETVSQNLFWVDKFYFVNKIGNILNFEYEVQVGDLINNFDIGTTTIILNNGGIFDIAGNEAEIRVNSLGQGINIDGVVPTIGLMGENYIEVPQFGKYLDLGVTVSDGEVTTNNNVDTYIGGEYKVDYEVIDDAGNKNSIVRKVKVIDTTAPTISKLSVTSLKLSVNSDEVGYLEWQGKCKSENSELIAGDNLIKIINVGDGEYNDCEVRAWDKWGNTGLWQQIERFVVDTTAPIIKYILPTPDDNIFVGNEVNITVESNENLKKCDLIKENSGKWDGEWISDGATYRSPALKNIDLTEKSMWQNILLKQDSELSFLWKVSSEKDWDYLKLYIEGELIYKISGEVEWREQKYKLTTGSHTIKFIYSKDYSNESGEDTGWVDHIKIEGEEKQISMTVLDKFATIKITNINSGVTQYKVSCTDLFDNQTELPERKIIKYIEESSLAETPIPAPYMIHKTNIVEPTTKATKVVAKKSGMVLGTAATPTSTLETTPEDGIKVKSDIPWNEIKFWAMGVLVLGTTSGMIVLDKKTI